MKTMRLALALVSTAVVTASAAAQPPRPAGPTPTSSTGVDPSARVQPPQPAAPRAPVRPRAVQAIALSSTAWADGGRIPDKYTQAGSETSPPLEWSGVPDDVVSFVLIVHDLDSVVGSGTDDTLQWMIWNIPAPTRSLGEGVPQGPDLADGSRQISATGPYYRGPGAAAAGPAHHYVFELFGLDTKVEVPAVGASPGQTRAAVDAAMAGHVRGKGVYVGLFKRP